MNRICRGIWLGLAMLMCLVSARWLAASCSMDEPTSTVFRLAPSGDWCKESVWYANCYYIRADDADGDKICDQGTNWDYNVPVPQCDPECSLVSALRKCSGGGTRSNPQQVTLWGCFSDTNCPE